MTEEWRNIAGWEGYFQISDAGNVRSLDRLIPYVDGRLRHHRGRIIKLGRHPDGYLQVTLAGKGRRTEIFVKVHHLVLEAFVGPRPNGMMGCHNDDDGFNNAVSNLRWDTSTNNGRDIVRRGRNNNAAKTQCSNGHLYDEVNTRWWRGHRYCRQCERDRSRRRRHRR